jgi:hypothetical protein
MRELAQGGNSHKATLAQKGLTQEGSLEKKEKNPRRG